MDIDTHVNSIVQGIVTQITSQVQTQAMAAITQKIDEVVGALDYTEVLTSLLSQKLDIHLSKLPIDTGSIQTELTSRVDTLAQNLSATVQAQSLRLIEDSVNTQIRQIDFNGLFQSSIVNALQNQSVTFPDSSIKHTALDLTELRLSGSQIEGGIVQQFGSTGIDDKATTCQLSIFDDITVVENNLLTKDLTVKGTATIEGDLNVTGTMPETSPLFQNVVAAATRSVCANSETFDTFLNNTLARIKTDGVDLNQITIGGQVAIDGNSLGGFIVNSNLQKVGQLKELQVAGESLLSDTLYTTQRRVGVNTIEPAQALSVWDQEIEVGIGKQSTNVAILGTPRSQTLIVSSNGKNNITLTPDGATAVNQLSIGSIMISASDSPPSSNQPRGAIVFNSMPSLGGPLGWVSLGDARWANFGIID